MHFYKRLLPVQGIPMRLLSSAIGNGLNHSKIRLRMKKMKEKFALMHAKWSNIDAETNYKNLHTATDRVDGSEFDLTINVCKMCIILSICVCKTMEKPS